MMDTFQRLGIPFPLFEAPVRDARDYVGFNTCSLCEQAGRHCFRLGIGCAVMVQCAMCGTENGLSAIRRSDATCRRCENVLRFPPVPGDVLTCYDCLRAGKAAITQDTELGMISW